MNSDNRGAVRRAAHGYIRHMGWAVLPLRGKSPAHWEIDGGHGYLTATTDTAEFDRIFDTAKYRADSVGIACKPSGFFVLDVDPRAGGDESLERLVLHYGPLPHTPCQQTGGGGFHYQFNPPADIELNEGAFAPGLEIKYRGHIVGAPSLHEDTKRPYAWDVDAHPYYIERADAPEWLIKMATKKKTAEGRVDYSKKQLTDIAEGGGRRCTLPSLAGHLYKHYVDDEVVRVLLWSWNLAQCKPPLSEEKFWPHVESIRQREMSKRAYANGGKA